jgi:hypothetical protein
VGDGSVATADNGSALTVADGSVSDGSALAGGWYLVAIDTPTRTYLDYVKVAAGGTWRPEVNGWPLLAQWDKESIATALRFLAFTPGDVVSTANIVTLLPALAPAPRTLDITAAPYGAKVSPADATKAIQAALNDAKTLANPNHPVDVVVPPGTYSYSAVLLVGADVRLRGTGGVLQATQPAQAAVHLSGDRSGALFLKLTSPATSRGSTPNASGIWVGAGSASGTIVHDTLVIGNDVSRSMGAHILALREIGGLWAFNNAHDGYADTFHHTAGSSFCQVVANRASGTATAGDDLYAFVGYAGDGNPVHLCSCLANEGHDGHARGLSAIGAGFIDFEENTITRTRDAGIYIARESGYATYGSFDVTVTGNNIQDANMVGAHDGLLAYADYPTDSNPSTTFGLVPNEIRNLSVGDNSFVDIAPGMGNGYGIEVRSSCQTGTVTGNTVTHAAVPGIVVQGTGFAVSSNVFSK